MTGPRSPRGKKAKGDLGEREAKAILESHGIRVLDGRMSEPGCDLILEPKAVVEVKNQPWRAIGGMDRASLEAAARSYRARGMAHWCLFHEPDGWFLCSIGRKSDGHIGLVYKVPIRKVHAQNPHTVPELMETLGLDASPRAESRAAIETCVDCGKPVRVKKPTGSRVKCGCQPSASDDARFTDPAIEEE